jgi:hypothetical protein
LGGEAVLADTSGSRGEQGNSLNLADTGLRSVTKKGRRAFILVVIAGIIVALSILGAAALVVMTTDLRIAGSYRDGVEAFHFADGGVRYVFAQIAADTAAGRLTLNGPSHAVFYAAPAGWRFDPVTNLTRLADQRSYTYRVMGRSGASRALIEAVVSHSPAFSLGLFGNLAATLKPTMVTYSYHSSETLHPVSSSGEATVGTNVRMEASPNTVDGTIYLGEDTNGVPAVYSAKTQSTIPVMNVPRINPDPMGVTSGYLAGVFAQVAVSNDNTRATGGKRSGSSLIISGKVTLPAGNYYVSAIDLRSRDVLTVQADAGPVNIYLTGPMLTASQSSIDVRPEDPGNLRIFSNSSLTIQCQPKAQFVGLIYAPLALIRMLPSGDFKGLLWGSELYLAPNGQCYVDVDLMNEMQAGPLRMVSWKQIFD